MELQARRRGKTPQQGVTLRRSVLRIGGDGHVEGAGSSSHTNVPAIGAHEREETGTAARRRRPCASRARPCLSESRYSTGARRAESVTPARVGHQRAACGVVWVEVRFDAQDATATSRPPARPTASAIAERAAGLIVQLMPAQSSIRSQEATARDPGPSAVIAKPTVSSTSGNSKPPSAAPDPVRGMHLEDRADHHGADENGADRREKPGRERGAGDELGRAREDGGHHRRPDAEALEARPRVAMTDRVQDGR
jgi:hypothetical protein